MSEGAASRPDGHSRATDEALRHWLEATLTEHKPGLSDSEWRVMRTVVANCATQALGECAEQLVDSFLTLRFPSVTERDGARQRMSARIAQTLCSDPTARQRLSEFQQLLQQSES